MTENRTLIVGGGLTGMETALQLSRHGISSVLVEQQDRMGGLLADISEFKPLVDDLSSQIDSSELIDVFTNSYPVKIRGVYKNFTVFLKIDDKNREDCFDNIIFAAGVEPKFPDQLFPDGPDKSVMTLLDFEKMKDNTHNLPDTGYFVFVLGFTPHSTAFSMQNALKNALELKKKNNSNVLIITDTVRFNDAWVTDLYESCREAGIIFIKSDEIPLFTKHNGIFNVSVKDAALNVSDQLAYLECEAAMILFEPEYYPVTFSKLFWSPHDPDRDTAGFYRPGNLHLYPVLSGRAGIYLAGAVTGIKEVEQCKREAELVAGHIIGMTKPHPVAIVEENKCAACLTCIRLCPHGAITIDRVANITEEACFGCGTCIAECPADAIKFDEDEDTKPVPDKPADLTVYCCEGSTYSPMKKILDDDSALKAKTKIKKLPCNGNLELVELLKSFTHKDAAVFVAACQDHNCKHLKGNRRAEKRVNRVKSILEELELDPARIQIQYFASNMQIQLNQAIKNFEKEISGGKQV